MQKRSVIFDLDGTLIDSADSVLESIEYALHVSALAAKMPICDYLIGPPLLEILSRVTGLTDRESLNVLVNSFCQYYDQSAYKKSVAYFGMEELLLDLKAQGLRLYIATNKRAIPTNKIIRHLGWQHLFSAVFSIDLLAEQRFANKAEMISALISLESLDLTKAIYVGDRVDDYEAACVNHLRCILVQWGYENEQTIQQAACQRVTNAKQLKTMILHSI